MPLYSCQIENKAIKKPCPEARQTKKDKIIISASEKKGKLGYGNFLRRKL
jgi:hypothetical protein